jgi:hypothetical protein
MWVSYEALCEMGATDIDPTSVFGVHPAELEQVRDIHKQQNLPLQERSVVSPSFFSAHSHSHQTPMEAVNPLQPMDLGTPSSAGSIPKASLFQTAHKPRTSSQKDAFETPNLTPIPQDASFAPHHHHHGEDPTELSFVDSANPHTIRRAKQVAARLYYQPSPETPDSAQMAPSRYLRGMGRNLLFSDTISDTPVRRGGRQSTAASTARKPRALFMMSENKTNNTKPEVEDDEPDMEQEQSQGDTQENQTTTIKRTVEYTAEVDEDRLVDNHGAVEEILELLCLLGAGYFRLCQVRKNCNRCWFFQKQGRPHSRTIYLAHSLFDDLLP